MSEASTYHGIDFGLQSGHLFLELLSLADKYLNLPRLQFVHTRGVDS